MNEFSNSYHCVSVCLCQGPAGMPGERGRPGPGGIAVRIIISPNTLNKVLRIEPESSAYCDDYDKVTITKSILFCLFSIIFRASVEHLVTSENLAQW